MDISAKHAKGELPNVRFGSWLCENANTLNRDRRSCSSKTVLIAQRASGFNLVIELKNIILRRVSIFEFSRSQVRERFVGVGPWRVKSPWSLAEYWTIEDADPRNVYHDVLIALDESLDLNNGQPSLWAFLVISNIPPDPRVAVIGNKRRPPSFSAAETAKSMP